VIAGRLVAGKPLGIAGIGLTVALVFATAPFPPGEVQGPRENGGTRQLFRGSVGDCGGLGVAIAAGVSTYRLRAESEISHAREITA
jgi:hypothetical protein